MYALLSGLYSDNGISASTTVSSDIIDSALASATMVVIELHELSRRIYAYTRYFIYFNLSHCALLAVINMIISYIRSIVQAG